MVRSCSLFIQGKEEVFESGARVGHQGALCAGESDMVRGEKREEGEEGEEGCGSGVRCR